MSKGWDGITLKKLKSLTGKGLSTAEIGKRLGMSKNAVVGKLNRMGWNLKAAEAKGTSIARTTTERANKKNGTTTKNTKSVATTKRAVAPKKAAKTPASKQNTVTPPKVKVVQHVSASRGNSKTLAMHQRIIQHSLEMANLKPNQCRWPIGDPDSENFHFCGKSVFVGKPYCYEHCRQAYQFNPPKKR